MIRRLLFTAVLIATAGAARAADRGALEEHLMRLSISAVTLGRTPADAPVHVVVGLGWRDRAALDQLVRDLADPQSPRYQRYLTPRQFERRFAPRAAQVISVTRFLRAAGLQVAEVSRSHLLVTAVGRAERVEQALATKLVEVLDDGRRHTVTSTRPALPAELGARVVAVGAGVALHPMQSAPRGPIDLPLDPTTVARLYAFDDLYAAGVTGNRSRASTIAIATAFAFDSADLQRFWSAMGIGRTLDSVELIPVAGKSGSEGPSADRLETTLDVEWSTAMAPDARVLVYAATDAMAPTFLRAYDRIVSDNRAAVMTTSWGRCEADYPASFLAQVDAVFARAAAQGITVIAAAGDHGAYECTEQDAPSVNFPASHPYVLAVGGTSLRPAGTGVDEVAWPDSGGGVSGLYAAPAWQMVADKKRAMADVALNADPGSGYVAYYQGGPTVLGGTSAGAPIWAALVALINQSRAAAGRAPLGLAAPMLCEVGLATGLDPAPLVDIIAGDNGAFAAGPGYDYPTGWGVPRAVDLAQTLSTWTPPANGHGGTALLVPLTPVGLDGEHSARLRFERRCLSTSLDLQVRRLPPGTYTLAVDGAPVASFAPDARGCAMLTLSGVDLRGRRVTVRAAGGKLLFSSDPGADPSPTATPAPSLQVHAELISTGVMADARGSVDYRATAGRAQLTLRASGLAEGTYEVRLAADSIGTLSVRAAAATAQFDSMGANGQPLQTTTRCKPVIVLRNGVSYLRSATDALSPGQCGR